MITIQNLHKKFKKLQVLQNVSATFRAGQVIALIGPNGSGKTTLIKSILGMVKPDSGAILFNGENIKGQDQYRQHIGYMPQIGRYPDHMKIGQVIDMMKNLRGIPPGGIDEELYHAFDMASLQGKAMHSLSGGTRQKVSATLAFLFRPGVLILDEPTAGLDPLASETLKTKIVTEKRKGRLILITSHILNDLEELATDVLYIQEGVVKCYDTLDNIRAITGQAKLSKAIALLMQHNFQPQQPAAAAHHSHTQSASHAKTL